MSWSKQYCVHPQTWMDTMNILCQLITWFAKGEINDKCNTWGIPLITQWTLTQMKWSLMQPFAKVAFCMYKILIMCTCKAFVISDLHTSMCDTMYLSQCIRYISIRTPPYKTILQTNAPPMIRSSLQICHKWIFGFSNDHDSYEKFLFNSPSINDIVLIILPSYQ